MLATSVSRRCTSYKVLELVCIAYSFVINIKCIQIKILAFSDFVITTEEEKGIANFLSDSIFCPACSKLIFRYSSIEVKVTFVIIYRRPVSYVYCLSSPEASIPSEPMKHSPPISEQHVTIFFAKLSQSPF